MVNLDIKVKMMETGIRQWELARLLNLSESHLSRKLRDELPQEEKKRIIELLTIEERKRK